MILWEVILEKGSIRGCVVILATPTISLYSISISTCNYKINLKYISIIFHPQRHLFCVFSHFWGCHMPLSLSKQTKKSLAELDNRDKLYVELSGSVECGGYTCK